MSPPTGIPVDLMVPEYPAPAPEAVAVCALRTASTLRDGRQESKRHRRQGSDDRRCADGSAAAPSSMSRSGRALVAKLHKIGERVGSPDRLNDKGRTRRIPVCWSRRIPMGSAKPWKQHWP